MGPSQSSLRVSGRKSMGLNVWLTQAGDAKSKSKITCSIVVAPEAVFAVYANSPRDA